MSLAEQRAAARHLSLLKPGLLALGFCLLALAAAAWVATFIFDRVPHVEDDVAFLFQARTIASGRLFLPIPPKPEFFDIPFTLQRDGLWFGKYPPGYPAVLALGVLAGQPWLVEPVLGALAVGLTYLLGRRLYGAWTGLVGAALMTASPFFLLQAGSFMSHAACLFWATLFMLLFFGARERDSIPLAGAAGLALGMLFISRQLTAVGVAAPFALWALGELFVARRRFWLYLAMGVGFLPFALGLLAYNAATTGDPWRSAYELYWAYDKLGFGPDYGVRGHYLADAVLNTRVNLEALTTYLFGWPGQSSLWPAMLAVAVATAGLLVGLAGHVGRRAAVARGLVPRGVDRPGLKPRAESTKPPAGGWERSQPAGRGDRPLAPTSARPCMAGRHGAGYDLLLAGVFVSLVVLHGAYWAFGQMYGPRYYFEALAALTLLSARGLALAAGALALGLRPLLGAGRARAAALAAVAALALGLFAWATRTSCRPSSARRCAGTTSTTPARERWRRPASTTPWSS